MCPLYKVLFLTISPMCKSTANPPQIHGERYVALSASQLLCFSSAFPRTSSLLRWLILSYHLIYRRVLVHLPETIWSPFPAPCPFNAATVLPATRCCQLPLTGPSNTPLQALQPLESPHPRIQASKQACFMQPSRIPLYPTDAATYLPISYTTLPYLLPCHLHTPHGSHPHFTALIPLL